MYGSGGYTGFVPKRPSSGGQHGYSRRTIGTLVSPLTTEGIGGISDLEARLLLAREGASRDVFDLPLDEYEDELPHWMKSPTALGEREANRRQRLETLEQTERTLFSVYLYKEQTSSPIDIIKLHQLLIAEEGARAMVMGAEAQSRAELERQRHVIDNSVRFLNHLVVCDCTVHDHQNHSSSSGGPSSRPSSLRSPLGVGTEGTAVDRLRRSLHAILHQLQGSDMAAKLHLIGDHLEKFFPINDLELLASKISTLYESTPDIPPPGPADQTEGEGGRASSSTPNRVAVCCVFLDYLLHYLSHWQPTLVGLCQHVRTEVYRYLFIDGHDNLPQLMPPPLRDWGTAEKVVDSAASLFRSRPTWQAAATETREDAKRLRKEGLMAQRNASTLQSALEKETWWSSGEVRKMRHQMEMLWRQVELNTYGMQAMQDKKETDAALQARLSQELADCKARLSQSEAHTKSLELLLSQSKAKETQVEKDLDTATQRCKELEHKLALLVNKDDVTPLQRELAQIREFARESEQTMEDRLKKERRNHAATMDELRATQQKLQHNNQQMDALERDAQQLSGLLDTMQSIFEGTPFESALRGDARHLVAQTSTSDTLRTWVNSLLSKHPAGMGRHVTEFGRAVDSLDAFLCLLRVLAPDHIREDECSRALRSAAPTKAHVLLQTLEQVCVAPKLTEADITTDGPVTEAAFTTIAGSLFERFCDPVMADALRLSPLSSENGVANPRRPGSWPAGAADVEKLEGVLQEYRLWRALGERTSRWVTEGLLGRIRKQACIVCGDNAAPQTMEDCLKVGQKLRDMGKYPQAKDMFDQALERDPKNAEAYRLRASLKHYNLNDYPGALDDYRGAIQLDPTNGLTYSQRADLLQYQLEEYPAALEDYNAAIDLGQRDANTYNNRGECLRRMKRNEDAMKDFTTALDVVPGHHRALPNRDELMQILIAEQRLQAEQAIKAALASLPTIKFQRNRFNLDGDDVASLDAVGEIMQKYQLVRLRVVGVTTNRNKIPLAERRSRACIAYLARKGVDRARMDSEGRHGGAMATMFEPIV